MSTSPQNVANGSDEGPTTNTTTTTPTVEDAFTLLSQGRGYEKEHEFWKAVDMFLQGRQILQTLAKNHPTDTDQDKKIASLYHDKAKEYLWHSRSTLIEALQLDVKSESTTTTDVTTTMTNDEDIDFISSLTDEQATLRTHLFCTLFSKPVEVFVVEQDKSEQEKLMEEQQISLEARFEQLNASMPTGFKTDQDEDDLDAINKGLNRLGLSLYTQKTPFVNFRESIPKSEDEQIDEIMAHVEDELAIEQQFGSTTGGGTGGPSGPVKAQQKHEEVDSGDESSEYDDPPEDLKLNFEQLTIKRIKRRILKSQMELTQLVARLDAAVKAKDDTTLDNDDDDDDDDDGDGYLVSGKKNLRQAHRQLKKALTEWDEEIR